MSLEKVVIVTYKLLWQITNSILIDTLIDNMHIFVFLIRVGIWIKTVWLESFNIAHHFSFHKQMDDGMGAGLLHTNSPNHNTISNVYRKLCPRKCFFIYYNPN